jgi:hypothetical protein
VVFSEIYFLFQVQFVSIHFCIEAVVFFEDTCQRAYPSVDTAPMSYTLTSIELRHNVFQMLLPKRLDRSALQLLD